MAASASSAGPRRSAGPPAYAWDWLARQRLVWREARSRIAAAPIAAATRYAAVDTRADVVAMLRTDYPRDVEVRRVVDEAVAEVAFLGRTDVAFADLGARNAPRGMRWWWTALTGEDVEGAGGAGQRPATESARPEPAQLTLDDVHEGYGG